MRDYNEMEHHSFPDTVIPPAYGPYSHAVVAGDFVFVAGQIARDSETDKLIDGDITAQTARSLEIVFRYFERPWALAGGRGTCNSLSIRHHEFRRHE